MNQLGEGSNFLLGQENWDSKIPLRLELAANEVTTVDKPPPLYVQGLRMGYTPSLAAEAFTYFRHVLPPGEDTPWFEAKGLPLWWQVPLGVLYDLLTNGEERPWRLTVHFRGFPSSSLLPWSGPSSLRSAYLNSLKEAAYICAGSSAAVMGMASGVQDDLWKSVEQGNFGQYYRISEGMNLASSRREGRRQSLPLRVYIKRGRGLPSDYECVNYTSRPIAAVREDASQPSLGDMLNDLLSEYFEARSTDNSNIGETASVSAASAPTQDSPQNQAAAREDEGQQWLIVGKSGHQKLQVDGKQVDVWVSGIRPKLDTPLVWLHSQLRHPDHFLYVVLHVY